MPLSKPRTRAGNGDERLHCHEIRVRTSHDVPERAQRIQAALIDLDGSRRSQSAVLRAALNLGLAELERRHALAAWPASD